MKPREVCIPARHRTCVGSLRLLGVALGALLALAAASLGQTPNHVPFVNQPLVPTAVAPGGPGFTLTVNGTGFVPGGTVNWNGSPRPTTFVSSSQLTAAIPATDIATIGSASVTVVNPAPGGGFSNAALFLITFPIPSVTFTRMDQSTNGAALAVVAADFNGDGKADIAVLRNDEVLVSLGNGDGTFQPQLSFPTGNDSAIPNGIVAADFDKDGKIDLAVAGHRLGTAPEEGSISVLLGNGDGTFQIVVNHAVTTFYPAAIACADFNGDGALDLAVTGNSETTGKVQTFLGSGDGSFLPGSEYGVANSYELKHAAVGDFNGDGALDLALARFDTLAHGSLVLLFGDSTGAFSFGVPIPVTIDRPLLSMAAADFNGDGELDLAAAYISDGRFGTTAAAVLLGNGDGSFQSPISYSAIGPYEVIPADLDGDGKLDLMTSGGGGLYALFGNGDGTFRTPPTQYDAPLTPTSLAAGDFDGDGRVDLAAGSYYSSGLSVFMQPSPVNLEPKTLRFGDYLVATPSSMLTATLTNNLTGPLTISNFAVTGVNAADFSESHDCPVSPATLAAGASCTITVTFDHTTLGDKSAAVTISDDAAGYLQQVLNLTGAVVDPKVSLSPSSLDFGTQALLVSSSPQNSTLTNSGVGRLTIADIHTIGEDFAVAHDCPTTVAEGGHCTVSVTYTPKTLGTHSEAVAIYDNASDSPQILKLTGTNVGATVTVSPASLDFGDQTINTTSSPQTLTILNSGAVPLLLTSIQLSGSFEYVSHCTFDVPISAGGSCTIDITFRPTIIGPNAETLTLWDNATGSPHIVNLTGTGLPSAKVSVTPTALDFGDLNVGSTSPVQAAIIKNTGSDAVYIETIETTGDFTREHDCPLSPAPLLSDASCTIIVSFHPTSPGTRTGALTISDNAVGSPHTVGLTGIGIGPGVSLSVAGLDFGGQIVGASSAAQTVTITNSGNQELSITGISLTGEQSSDYTFANACGASLAATASCTASVTFTPTATGARRAALVVANNASGNPHTVTLTGTGTDFTLGTQSGGSMSATITAGGTAMFNLQLAPTGFSGTVGLACAFQGSTPRGASCSVSPSSVTANGVDPAPFVVNVATTARSIAAPQVGDYKSPLQPLVLAMLMGLLLLLMASKSRRVRESAAADATSVVAAIYDRRPESAGAFPSADGLQPALQVGRSAIRWALLATTLLAILLWAACGGGDNPAPTGTPAGAYTLTLTATAGSVSRSTPLTLNVN